MVNERDELGSDLVPDYLTSVKEGQFYGWPFSYWGQYVDDRVKPQDPELVAKAGYKVVFVAFSDGKPTGAPVDVLTGFVSDSEKAGGRSSCEGRVADRCRRCRQYHLARVASGANQHALMVSANTDPR